MPLNEIRLKYNRKRAGRLTKSQEVRHWRTLWEDFQFNSKDRNYIKVRLIRCKREEGLGGEVETVEASGNEMKNPLRRRRRVLSVVHISMEVTESSLSSYR